jgi:hypothetical protein
MFQLSYTRTPDDFRQYQYLLHVRMQRTLWRGMLRAFGQPMVIVMVFFLLMVVGYQVQSGRSDTLFFLLGGIVVGILLSAFLLMRTSTDVALLRPNGPYTGFVQLTANDQGVSILLPLFRQEFGWGAVESISNAGGSLILWVEPSMGEHIPARAFTSQDQRTAFFDFVSARLPGGGGAALTH